METQATHCFCGCGQQVRNPRLVVANTTGWELSTELVEWLKFEMLFNSSTTDVVGSHEDFVDTGHELWVSLANSLHAEERPDKLDEVNAVRWAKHSRKSRRKLKRSFRRDGVPNPFDLPTSDLDELRAWITEETRPGWAQEVLGDEEGDLDFGDVDYEQIRRQGEASYRRHMEGLNEGPDVWMKDDPEQVAAARQIYEPVRERLDAIEQGQEAPYPLPDESRRFVEAELSDKMDAVDASDFAEASALGVVIGMLIRETEGADAAPLSDEFLAALDEGSTTTDSIWTVTRLRELADLTRDLSGPPDESGNPSNFSTDPVLLSLFAWGAEAWKGLEAWSSEYVRLKTMYVPGVAITSPENRVKAIRFGYMLAALLQANVKFNPMTLKAETLRRELEEFLAGSERKWLPERWRGLATDYAIAMEGVSDADETWLATTDALFAGYSLRRVEHDHDCAKAVPTDIAEMARQLDPDDSDEAVGLVRSIGDQRLDDLISAPRTVWDEIETSWVREWAMEQCRRREMQQHAALDTRVPPVIDYEGAFRFGYVMACFVDAAQPIDDFLRAWSAAYHDEQGLYCSEAAKYSVSLFARMSEFEPHTEGRDMLVMSMARGGYAMRRTEEAQEGPLLMSRDMRALFEGYSSGLLDRGERDYDAIDVLTFCGEVGFGPT